MKRWHFLGYLVAAVGVVGCRLVPIDGQAVPVGGRLHSDVTGVVTELPPGNFVYTDFSSASLDGQPVRLPLRPYRRLTTDKIVRVDVSQLTEEGNTDYSVLFGPPFGVLDASVDGWIHTSRARFDIAGTGGWVYATMIWPWVAARWVSAQTIGSKLILQIVDDTHRRIIFLEGSKIIVTCEVGARKSASWTRPTTDTTEWYFDVKLNSAGTDCEFDPAPGLSGNILNPHLVSSNEALRAFVDKVKAAASAAGL